MQETKAEVNRGPGYGLTNENSNARRRQSNRPEDEIKQIILPSTGFRPAAVSVHTYALYIYILCFPNLRPTVNSDHSLSLDLGKRVRHECTFI